MWRSTWKCAADWRRFVTFQSRFLTVSNARTTAILLLSYHIVVSSRIRALQDIKSATKVKHSVWIYKTPVTALWKSKCSSWSDKCSDHAISFEDYSHCWSIHTSTLFRFSLVLHETAQLDVFLLRATRPKSRAVRTTSTGSASGKSILFPTPTTESGQIPAIWSNVNKAYLVLGKVSGEEASTTNCEIQQVWVFKIWLFEIMIELDSPRLLLLNILVFVCWKSR